MGYKITELLGVIGCRFSVFGYRLLHTWPARRLAPSLKQSTGLFFNARPGGDWKWLQQIAALHCVSLAMTGKKIYNNSINAVKENYFLLLIKFIITLTIISLSSDLDSAIIKVSATKALSSITLLS